MAIFDDLKAKADANGDGKLSADDLNDLRDKLPTEKFDQLKSLADQNDDGKISLEDVKSFNLGDTIGGLKDTLGGLFGGKK